MKVVYELGDIPRPWFQGDPALIAAAVIVLICIYLLKVVLKEKKKRGTLPVGLIVSTSLATVGLALLFAIMIYGSVKMNEFGQNLYDAVVVAYQNGEYETVEGTIENFHAMPPTGHDSDNFEVNGVFFRMNKSYGYKKQKVRGSVFTGDGQYVRIGYICYEDDNYIVKIEVLDETPATEGT